MKANARICAVFAAAICLSLPPEPGGAGEDWINAEQVAACLADAPGHPEACLPIVVAPCDHHAESGFLRACLFRLRQRWERAIALDGSVTRLPYDPVCMAYLGAWRGFEPYAVRQQRNACRLLATTLVFFGLEAMRHAAFAADIESAESCALETAHVGIETTCIWLIRDFCLSDGLAARTCEARERAVWEAIHIANGGRETPHRPLRELAVLAMQTLLHAEQAD